MFLYIWSKFLVRPSLKNIGVIIDWYRIAKIYISFVLQILIINEIRVIQLMHEKGMVVKSPSLWTFKFVQISQLLIITI